MDKSKRFFGQSVFGQLISLIDDSLITWAVKKYKQLKQNFPLRYFLGDNKNAIKTQIWCALITNLLLMVVMKSVKRKWAFSNIVNFTRLHLFNYISLFRFLENPERDWNREIGHTQLEMNLEGGLLF